LTKRLTKTALFRFLAIILMVGMPLGVHAQIESSGFPVLQLETSARSAALAGATTALSESSSNAFFSNPALLTPVANGRLAVSYLNHVSDLNAGWLSYAKQIDSLGTFGIGLRYLSFGSFTERDDVGEEIGTFGASDIALTLAGARALNTHVHYGANLHVMRSSIASESAAALAMDVGVTYVSTSALSSFSASVHNLGLVLSSIGNRSDDLPLDVRIGFTQKLAHLPLLVTLTGYRLTSLDGGESGNASVASVLNHVRIAGEFQFSKAFQIRFGYNHRQHESLKVKSRLDMAGFSTGIGLVIAKIGVDYSFNSWSSLGALHRFSIVSTL